MKRLYAAAANGELHPNPYALALGMSVLGLYLLRHYWLDFRRAFTPSSVFSITAVTTVLQSVVRSPLSTSLQKLSVLQRESAEYTKQRNEFLLLAYTLNSTLTYIAHKFDAVIKGRMFDVYLIATFFWTLASTLIVFAVEYWGLYKVDPSHFGKLKGEPSFLEFLGFSFNTLSTASISPIVPHSGIAQSLCYVEILFGIMLITIVVTMVSAILRERYHDDIQKVIVELNTSATAISSQIEHEFHLTASDLEIALAMANNLVIVNLLRYMHGQAAMSPIVPTQPNETAAAAPTVVDQL